jgi:hypothetical protein
MLVGCGNADLDHWRLLEKRRLRQRHAARAEIVGHMKGQQVATGPKAAAASSGEAQRPSWPGGHRNQQTAGGVAVSSCSSIRTPAAGRPALVSST